MNNKVLLHTSGQRVQQNYHLQYQSGQLDCI